MLTPCERMLINEEREARRAFAEHRPIPAPDDNHVVTLSPSGVLERDAAMEAWVGELRVKRLRWHLALDDIAWHLREHGEIEAERGTWQMNGLGRPVFVAANREDAA